MRLAVQKRWLLHVGWGHKRIGLWWKQTASLLVWVSGAWGKGWVIDVVVVDTWLSWAFKRLANSIFNLERVQFLWETVCGRLIVIKHGLNGLSHQKRLLMVYLGTKPLRLVHLAEGTLVARCDLLREVSKWRDEWTRLSWREWTTCLPSEVVGLLTWNQWLLPSLFIHVSWLKIYRWWERLWNVMERASSDILVWFLR